MAVNKVVYGGKTVIDLTNDTVSPSDLMSGVTAHGANGQTITGTFSLDTEISAQDTLIAQIKSALEGKASGGGGTTIETCTATVNQVWGGNDDPSHCEVSVIYQDIQADGSSRYGVANLTSNEDYEPIHSLTIRVIKNTPIIVITRTGGGVDPTQYITIDTEGGTSNIYDTQDVLALYAGNMVIQFIPTADTATITIASD